MGVSLLITPQLSLDLQVKGRSLTVVLAYESNRSEEYLSFLEDLGGVLEGLPTEDTSVTQAGTVL